LIIRAAAKLNKRKLKRKEKKSKKREALAGGASILRTPQD
jgi:hypothetical protein